MNEITIKEGPGLGHKGLGQQEEDTGKETGKEQVEREIENQKDVGSWKSREG